MVGHGRRGRGALGNIMDGVGVDGVGQSKGRWWEAMELEFLLDV